MNKNFFISFGNVKRKSRFDFVCVWICVFIYFQDKMVYESMKKLEIKRMRDALYKKADEVLSLEKHQLQLKTAMEERHHEIEIHKEMLATQLRTADDEKRQISAELHERISKIDKLKKRYNVGLYSCANDSLVD